MKASEDAGLKQMKVISREEDGGWERVPVSGGHRDDESTCSIINLLILVLRERVIRESIE